MYWSFRIRNGFNTDLDPDPAVYLNADQIRIRIQGARPMRIRILVRLCRHKKLDFYLKYTGTSVGKNQF